jgi:arylformamidase
VSRPRRPARPSRPRIVDLTRPITHEMANFPGEPRPGFVEFGGLHDLGFRCHQVLMPTHFGTHADAYSHFLEDGLPIDRMPAGAYVGPAAVVDVRRRPDPARVTRRDLQRAWPASGAARRVLLRTGWAERTTGAAYFHGFPGLTADAAAWLARGPRPRLLGLDLPSVHPTEYARVHRTLFRARIAVVEGLVRLDRIGAPRCFLVAAPLPLRGLDGAPLRALAVVGRPGAL